MCPDSTVYPAWCGGIVQAGPGWASRCSPLSPWPQTQEREGEMRNNSSISLTGKYITYMLVPHTQPLARRSANLSYVAMCLSWSIFKKQLWLLWEAYRVDTCFKFACYRNLRLQSNPHDSLFGSLPRLWLKRLDFCCFVHPLTVKPLRCFMRDMCVWVGVSLCVSVWMCVLSPHCSWYGRIQHQGEWGLFPTGTPAIWKQLTSITSPSHHGFDSISHCLFVCVCPFRPVEHRTHTGWPWDSWFWRATVSHHSCIPWSG